MRTQPSGRSASIDSYRMTVLQIVAVSVGSYVLLLGALFAWLHYVSRAPQHEPAPLLLTRIVDDDDLRDAA